MGRLDGRVALVSGAARGLGQAIARELLAEGGVVVLGDVLDAAASPAAADHPDQTLTLHLDVTSEASWDAAIKATTERFGALHVLVNNAGTAEGSPLWETSLESYRRVTEVNQTGVFLGMRAAVAPMTASGGGSIVNISSIDGLVGSPRIISYIASKWAVRGMTKAAAMELAPRNIRVNSVHPGYVHTLLASQPGQDRAPIEAVIDLHTRRFAPMQRTGTPSEIAKLVAFLASDDSSYCTGSEFVADGGLTAGYAAPASPDPF